MFFGQEQNQDTISYKGIRSGKVPRNFLKFIKSFLMLFGQQQNQDTNMSRKWRIQGKRKGKKRAKLTTCFRTQLKKKGKNLRVSQECWKRFENFHLQYQKYIPIRLD